MGRCLNGVDLRTLVAEFAGSSDSIYPNIVRIGEPVKFTVNYALVGLQLSSSLTIFGANRGGIVLVVGNQPRRITLSNSVQTPITHITGPNSISTPSIVAVPTSKVTSLSFGAYGLAIPSGTPISLYAFADATSGNDLFAICSLQLIQYVQ